MTNFTTLRINVNSESGLYNSILTVLKHISIMYESDKKIFNHKHINVTTISFFIEYDITNCKDYKAYKTLHKFI